MSTKTTGRWTAEEKLRILAAGRQADQTLSLRFIESPDKSGEVCRRHQIAPGPFSLGEKQAQPGALPALRNAPRGRKPASTETRRRAEVESRCIGTRGGRRTEHGKPATEKGAWELTPHRRHDAPRKALILETVQRAQAHSGQSVTQILRRLSGSPATYSRWKEREQAGRLTDRVVTPRRPPLPPTPEEVRAVAGFARAHPLVGYKRLAWEMVDENIAYGSPSQG